MIIIVAVTRTLRCTRPTKKKTIDIKKEKGKN